MDQIEINENSKKVAVHPLTDQLKPIQEMVRTCIQCGTCTGSCPNAFAMDHTPRQLWRMVLMEKTDEIFQSKTFTLCSSCYYCTLRCPRGLTLTEAMSGLKQIAARQGFSKYNQSTLFYKSFLGSVRRHGRVKEMEFMTLYFASMKNPILPIQFTPLGIKLLLKRKISVQIPLKGHSSLNTIFKKIKELEAGS